MSNLIVEETMKQTFYVLIAALIVLLAATVEAQTITLPWSTTYNCPELIEGTSPWIGGGANLGCDGIQSTGSWTANGQGEQITSVANNPSGAGGRGQRQWNCDGSNCNSGNAQVTFSTPPTEVWVRWYMRYQSGYTWGTKAYDKLLYFDDTVVSFQWQGANDKFIVIAGGTGYYAGAGFDTMNGGATGDGQFHCLEVHLKHVSAGHDVFESWINGANYGTATDITYTVPSWNTMLIGSNQAIPANGANAYVDFDDIAISNTGRIGCIASNLPAPPKNLRIN